MAGSTDSLLERLNGAWEAREYLMSTQAYKDQEKRIEWIIALLRAHAKENDIVVMLNDERVMIRHALKFDANSQEEAQSLKAAAIQLDEAAECLRIVRDNPQAYAVSAQTYPAKRREAGLPMDALREFLKSHGARLSNRLAGQGTSSEKQLLRQRKANLDLIKESYSALQRDALGPVSASSRATSFGNEEPIPPLRHPGEGRDPCFSHP